MAIRDKGLEKWVRGLNFTLPARLPIIYMCKLIILHLYFKMILLITNLYPYVAL